MDCLVVVGGLSGFVFAREMTNADKRYRVLERLPTWKAMSIVRKMWGIVTSQETTAKGAQQRAEYKYYDMDDVLASAPGKGRDFVALKLS